MIIRIQSLLILLLAVFAGPFVGEALAFTAKPSFNRVEIPSANSLGGIFAVAQDPHGFLWFGGKNGLLRYDGYRVDYFRHDPDDPHSLASSDISDLYVDSQGQLWIGMLSNGALARFDYATERFIRYRHDLQDPSSLAGNNVYAIAEDNFGNLWLGTHEGGLNKWDRRTGKFQRYEQTLGTENDNAIVDVAVDRFGNVWAASAHRGLYRYNILHDQFTHYRHHPEDQQSLSGDQLQRLYIDQFDSVWVGTLDAGVNRFYRPKGYFERYRHQPDDPTSLGSGRVWTIGEDGAGQLWVATGNGALNRFDKWQNQFDRFHPDEYAPNSLAGTVVSMMVDQAGDFWLGTYNSKLNRVTDRGPHFEVMRHSPNNPDSLLSSDVTALTSGNDNTLWVASAKGLSAYSPSSPNGERFKHFASQNHRQHKLPPSPVRALSVGPDGRLWVGTNGQGLWYLPFGESEFKEFTDRFNKPLKAQKIWSLRFSGDGRLWVGTQNKGLAVINPAELTVHYHAHDNSDPTSLSNNFVWHTLVDSSGRIWVATQYGLSVTKPEENGRFTRYFAENSGLHSSVCHALIEDADGNIWVGTTAGLSRYDPINDNFVSYGIREGLYGDSISSLTADDRGHLWMATQRGISRFNPQSGVMQHYDTRHGAASDTSARNAATARLPNGELFFASPNGVTRVNPHTLRGNLLPPPVVLTGLFIDNQRVAVGHAILPVALNTLESLSLPPDHNVFAVEFSALNYLVPEQNRYQYKLLGFDQTWRETGADQRRATYTNLSPGSYTFLLKGANNDGVWNAAPRQLHIHIAAPWWRSGWAYITYFALLSAAGYFIWNMYQRRVRDAEGLNRRLRELDQLKAQLLTNTSEELRTPLNVIVGLSENLLEGGAGDLPEVAERQIKVIRDNGQWLSKMVDELLDFSDFSRDQIELNCRMTDVQSVVERAVQWFRPKADEKGLHLDYVVGDELPLIWADANRVQQMLFCLLDNALKFTDQGRVDVVVRCAQSDVTVSVADTGAGISAERLEDIFRGFEYGGRRHEEGMGLGLGLARVKHLAELHGGRIEVKSKPHKGSVFTLILPKEKPQSEED